ncbi:MAG: SMC-Scp complex subunit ScpB [Selenomonas sp.]|nr:SMC-Scp complex subunit ScpB [Veillonellaceae bacterium]MDD6698282.1 SMC-Scp complex subunit ScpB [Veillonellaceae bacterium]MDY6348959.1 SMC-Scp complex subunit ScpB [Selenomonas sp.]
MTPEHKEQSEQNRQEGKGSSLAQILEAVLFAAGDPVRMDELLRILGCTPEALESAAAELRTTLDDRGSALTLREVAGGWQLVTRPAYYHYLEKLTQILDHKLTTPTMETLSIIAYRQPITKTEIEEIRGVRIEKSLARLLEYGLIEERGRKATIGRPILYATTDMFLEAFGLKSLEDLPNLLTDQEAAEGLAPEQLALIEAGELKGN